MARIDQKKFYQDNYDTYGVSAQGVAWDSARTQQRRFSAILSCLGGIGDDTLVDAGCGFGDLYLYLRGKGAVPREYLGLDLCMPMVARAREITGCKILQRDILTQKLPLADWYVASGSMNLLTALETRIFIQRCFERSRKGFVFNLLEGRSRQDAYSYWSPHEIMRFCRTLSAKVTCKEGYLEGDFTVMMLV